MSHPKVTPGGFAASPIFDDATDDWLDAFPVAQKGKIELGLKGRLLTVAEAALLLRLKPATVCKHLRHGIISGQRLSSAWRIYEADLDAFLVSKATGAGAHKSIGNDRMT